MFRYVKLNTIIIFALLVIVFNCFFFFEYMMPFHWVVFGTVIFILCVMAVFHLNKKWAGLDRKMFITKISRLSFVINLISIGIVYIVCYLYDGTFFEPRAADSLIYHEHGVDLAMMFRNFDFNVGDYLYDNDYSDYGYNVFLGTIYAVFGPYTLVARLANALLLTLTVVSIFKITETIFDTKTGKTAALLTTFSPLLLYFLGVNLKESVMIFILVYAVDLAVSIVLKNNTKLHNFIFLIIFILLLFFFRTVLGMVFMLSFIFFYVINISFKKSVYRFTTVLGLFISIAVVVYYLDQIGMVDMITDTYYQSDSQTDSELSDKANQGGGSGLSIKKALIVPLLFIAVLAAPFATLVFLDGQFESAWLFSGCLIKNCIVFFCIYGLIFSFRYLGKKSMMIISILFLYSLVIAVSAQSTSIRYQLVGLPFIHIFSAVGLHDFKPQRKTTWLIYLFAIFIAIFSWNYFKLSIRDLI